MNDGQFGDFINIPPHCSITPQQMNDRTQSGATIFQEIIKQSINQKELLLNTSNWSIIIDLMYERTRWKPKDKIHLLNKLITICKNSLLPPDEYRMMRHNDVNNVRTSRPGFREFIEGLGFINGILEDKLVMVNLNRTMIQTAIHAIENKLKLIHHYEKLCTLWQITMSLMLNHPLYKNNHFALAKYIPMDFLLHYNQYYDILTTLISISSAKIMSRDGLIMEMMTNLGINVSQMGNDEKSTRIFDSMGKIYDSFKTIEEFKRDIRLTNYYKMKNEYEHKYDGNDDTKSDALKEIENRKNTGIEHFANILNIKSDDDRLSALLNPLHWDILIDAMCLNMGSGDDKIKKLRKLKNMAQKACHDLNFRVILMSHPQAIKYIINTRGAIVFLKGVGFYKYDADKYLVYLPESGSRPISEMAINTMMHKIKILQRKLSLQQTWKLLMVIVLKHPSFAHQMDVVAWLNSMDLYNNYGNYFDISGKVQQTLSDDLKRVPMKFGKLLGLDLDLAHVYNIDQDSTKKMLRCLLSVFKKINEIEEEEQRYNSYKLSYEKLCKLWNEAMDSISNYPPLRI